MQSVSMDREMWRINLEPLPPILKEKRVRKREALKVSYLVDSPIGRRKISFTIAEKLILPCTIAMSREISHGSQKFFFF